MPSWLFLALFGPFWLTLAHSGPLWLALAHSSSLWLTLARSCSCPCKHHQVVAVYKRSSALSCSDWGQIIIWVFLFFTASLLYFNTIIFADIRSPNFTKTELQQIEFLFIATFKYLLFMILYSVIKGGENQKQKYSMTHLNFVKICL